MIPPVYLLLLVSVIFAFGLFVAHQTGREEKRFTWHEYLILAGIPFITLIPVWLTYGAKALVLFLASAVIGLVVEHVMGYIFHTSLKRHLWRYYRFTWGGYTSLLIAPFWGMTGVFFFLLAQAIGV